MRHGSLVRKVDDGERTASDFPQVNWDLSMQGEGAGVATPGQVSVWVGLDVGKESHFADVLDNDGERLFSWAVGNDQGDIEALLDRASKHGVPGLVIDQPGSIAQLVLAVAARREVPVAYVPGLVMRRAADLYPGEAKTDRRDAFILADTARTRRKQVHWLDAASDELLAQLRVLNGFDTDLGEDQTRVTSRLRDALTSISPDRRGSVPVPELDCSEMTIRWDGSEPHRSPLTWAPRLGLRLP